MSVAAADAVFAGAVPQAYETWLVPLWFAPYADDLVARLQRRAPARVLELACGTGAVTRAMARGLPSSVEIVATDLNPGMLQEAERIGTSRPVAWRQADAMKLPFPDASFDVVVVQFGVMFLPDRAQGYAEALRVLRDGGTFLFNVWDRIADNELADVAERALASVFPADPPRFFSRTPYGHHDVDELRRDLQAGGFTSSPRIATVPLPCRALSARTAAVAICQGTPLRGEIEQRDPSSLARATDVVTEAIAARFGAGESDSKMQAIVVEVAR